MADHRDVRDSLGYACETAQTSKVQALETMAKRVDTHSIKESAVFLFNPLPWPRKALLELHTDQIPIALVSSPISQHLTAPGFPSSSCRRTA
jgi:alpha-mannosidase